MLDFVQPQVAGYRSCRWWGRSVAILQPLPWNRQKSNDALRLPEGAELCRTRNRMDGPALSRGWGACPQPLTHPAIGP